MARFQVIRNGDLEHAPRPRNRRAWRWVLAAGIAALLVLVIGIVSVVPFSSDILRRKLVTTLSDRLASDVEIADVHIRALPRFRAQVAGVTIRKRDARDVPPLIRVSAISVDTGLLTLLRRHVEDVAVTGLEINIPPRTDGDGSPPAAGDPGGQRDQSSGTDLVASAGDLVIDHLHAVDARLVIIPRERARPSRVWAIHKLEMRSVSFGRAMPFDATLTNAVPPGEIDVKGNIGPWSSVEPGATPLDGRFTFANADLGVFKGISGILSAHGDFGGTLGRLGVHGETDTPQFTVAVGGHPVPLHAEYHATVDGTNGNTLLDRIDASFLNTSLVAKGSVVGNPGKDGRTVTLDVVMDKARIEDVLRLAVKASKAPMTGAMKLRTKFVLPPGDRDVVQKLRLDGQFTIGTARFTSIDIQKKIDELSRRSRGESAEADQPSAASNFRGEFRLADATLTLRTLTFETPGASVQLAGTYDLRRETLGFKGLFLMDAKISETQKGWKRFVLKVVDPLFAKKGGEGTELPIKIEGKRSQPAFGLDRGRLFKRRK
jgi:AsmA-like C-terminal region